MSANSSGKPPTVTYDNILLFIREHEDPVVTAGEIADHFEVTNQAANYRLKELAKREKVVEKHVGSSAKVWYPKG